MNSDDPGRYNEVLQACDSSYHRSKGEKKQIRKVVEYEKFLGVHNSLQALI